MSSKQPMYVLCIERRDGSIVRIGPMGMGALRAQAEVVRQMGLRQWARVA